VDIEMNGRNWWREGRENMARIVMKSTKATTKISFLFSIDKGNA